MSLLSLKEIKSNLIARLNKLDIERAEAEAQADLIIEHATGWSKTEQFLNLESSPNAEQLQTIEEISKARETRKPLQYCLGYAYFFGLKLAVCPGVFIPRTDTETLVTTTLNALKDQHAPRICEIGTGSGGISIALLKALPQAKILGIDLSDKAIAQTKANAITHDVSDRLELICDHWSNALEKHCAPNSLNALVSNPPYVERSAKLAKEVRDWEPELALFGESDDELAFYKQISRQASKYLAPKGILVLEIGDAQKPAVESILHEAGWNKIETKRDINGLDRVILAQR